LDGIQFAHIWTSATGQGDPEKSSLSEDDSKDMLKRLLLFQTETDLHIRVYRKCDELY
jgi:hypothetical protein